MRKIYILSLCALMGASAVMADSRFQTRRGTPRKSVMKAESATPIWRPASQTDYMYIDGEWMELGATAFTYDSRGNAVREDLEDEDGISRVVTEFNEYDQPVSVIATAEEDGVWVNNSKRTYVYDPVLHDYFIERLGFDWSEGEWVRNYYCETNVITRNDDNNIIEIVKSLPFMDSFIPAYKAVWNYDQTTGRANEFFYYSNNAGTEVPEWELYDETSYHNIVWEATDGQMTESNFNDMVEGANRVKSCEVYYGGELDGHILVEYSESAPGAYFIKETYADISVVGATSRKEILDDNGSFRLTDSEYFDEEGNPTAEPTYVSVQEVTFDDHGNAILETVTETFEGVTEQVDGSKADYTYDDNGNPTEVVISLYSYDDGEYLPDSKIVYGEYTDVSAGIDNVLAGKREDGFTVYNLQGTLLLKGASADSMAALPAGLYIINGEKRLINK